MKIFLILPLFIYSFQLCAQKTIRIYHEKDRNDDYVFYCDNNAYCDYIVEIKFKSLVNLKINASRPFEKVVHPGTNRLFKLEKMRDNSSIDFSYSTSYRKGNIKPKIKEDIIYLLPVAEGKETSITLIDYLGSRFKEKEPKNWYALSFKMNQGDTVFACRRGRVVSLEEGADPKQKNLTFTREDNYIEVFHEDGTFGRYVVFEQDQIFVNPGEYFNAGDPLGIVGGENYTSGYHVRFMTYYSFEEPVVQDGKKVDRKHYWAYLPLKFCTENHSSQMLLPYKKYISVHPEQMIVQEMSKREIRRWKKGK